MGNIICHIGSFKMITFHNILEWLWCQWCCCGEVYLGHNPIVDWSNILFHGWCWLGMPLQASHAVSLAWLGLAWPRFKCRSKIFICKSTQIYITSKNNTNSTETIHTATHDFGSRATSYQTSWPDMLAPNISVRNTNRFQLPSVTSNNFMY
jgi:hypothetical protein